MKEIQQHHHKLLILYATQTGNSLDAAERLAREAERRACPINLLSLHDYDPVRFIFSFFFLCPFSMLGFVQNRFLILKFEFFDNGSLCLFTESVTTGRSCGFCGFYHWSG